MKNLQYLKLKAELLVEGIRATPVALKEIGKKYKEQNHGLFGWDFEDHAGSPFPMIFFFRMEPWSSSEGIPVHPIRSLWKKTT